MGIIFSIVDIATTTIVLHQKIVQTREKVYWIAERFAKYAPNFWQKCAKNATKMYQKCAKNVPKMCQKCAWNVPKSETFLQRNPLLLGILIKLYLFLFLKGLYVKVCYLGNFKKNKNTLNWGSPVIR